MTATIAPLLLLPMMLNRLIHKVIPTGHQLIDTPALIFSAQELVTLYKLNLVAYHPHLLLGVTQTPTGLQDATLNRSGSFWSITAGWSKSGAGNVTR